MSDYEFKCGDCKSVNSIHSSGDTPIYGEKVECIKCGRVSEVTSSFATLDVVKTKEKKTPSQIDKLNKDKFAEDVKGEVKG